MQRDTCNSCDILLNGLGFWNQQAHVASTYENYESEVNWNHTGILIRTVDVETDSARQGMLNEKFKDVDP